MIVFPPCKINLGLHVLRKRSDGYHDIETCFYPVPWTDILEIIPSKEFSFSLTGNPVPGNEEENLCVKAYRLLAQDIPLPPVNIHLHKIIPAGAGMGGGSSDGAWTLRVLNDVFDLKLSKDGLKQYASKLGSDCVFFIDDSPMIGTGRGEVLSAVEVDLKGKYLMIVKPEVHISTRQAYEGVVPSVPARKLADVIGNFGEWKFQLKNDFEASILEKFPVIRNIKQTLYTAGAEYASMTGSGSAVYGIFSKKPDVDAGETVQSVVRL
ncbi:MAG TPA: 4-(cytidine 5'-diphospho)-2-C-methyl-D-erythritol kinase [Cyclobacteriaceae bacterium]|nr:4-(cytidine 5'-diphospho)-2-C-methyl-D-erythritol kinase [Cyclobacteriaceae bacterium]